MTKASIGAYLQQRLTICSSDSRAPQPQQASKQATTKRVSPLTLSRTSTLLEKRGPNRPRMSLCGALLDTLVIFMMGAENDQIIKW